MAVEYNSKQFESGTAVDLTKEDVGAKKITLKNIPVSGSVEIGAYTITDKALYWLKAPSAAELEKLTESTNFDNAAAIVDHSTGNEPKIEKIETTTGFNHFAVFRLIVQASVSLTEVTYIARVVEDVRVKLQVDGLSQAAFLQESLRPTDPTTVSAFIDKVDNYKLKYTCRIDAMSVNATGNADVTVALVTPKSI